MTIEDIVNKAKSLIGNKDINIYTGGSLIQDGMNILSSMYDTACVKDKVQITCDDSASTFYPLPEDCVGVCRVTAEGRKTNKYIIQSNSIKFNYLGTYEIEYYKYPVLIERQSYDVMSMKKDVPPINGSYHLSLCYYVAANILMLDNPDNPIAERYSNLFEQYAQNVNNKLSTPKRAGIRIKAPVWR